MSSEDFDFAPVVFDESISKTYDEQVADKFNQLASLNLNDVAESKNGLTYVSWSNAWKAFKEVYPTATYKILKNPQTNLPYFVDPLIGIMVFTEVSANGLTYEMWLPVMDGANKAMRLEPYNYQVWNKTEKKYDSRKVEAATMFDMNKAIMRCLVKNLAMYGLALYIYQGEDIPEIESPVEAQAQPQQQTRTRKPKNADRYDGIRRTINAANTTQELTALYRQHESEVRNNPQVLALFTARKEELLNAA